MRAWMPLVLWVVWLCPAVVLAAPDTRITSGPPVYTNQMSASFLFTSTTAGVSYECSLNGSSYSLCTSPMSFSGLSNGRHLFAVRATDASGVDTTPARYLWTVDTMDPVVQISQPAVGAVVGSRAPVIKGTVDNPFSEVRVFIDEQSAGSTSADENGDWSLESSLELANGSHGVNAEATDQAGNVGARTASIDFSVNTKPPDTVIVEGPQRIHRSSLAAFAFDSPSGATSFECQLDAASDFVPCAAEHLITKLAEGAHTLKVRAKDSAGNVDPSPAVHEWSVSLRVPSSPEISEPAEGAVVDTQTPLVSGSAASRGLVAVYVNDKKIGVVQADEGGRWGLRPTTPLDEGQHKLMAEAVLEAGGSGESRSSVRSFAVSLGGCSASGSQPLLPLVGLGLILLARRRRYS